MRNVFTWQRAQSTALALTAAGVLLLLAACSDDSADSESGEAQSGSDQPVNIVQGAAPGEPSRRIDPEDLERTEATPHTRADVDFMQGMIHHHAQALVMTSMVRDRSASRDIPILARRIEVSQEMEVETMERWLRERDEDVPTAEDHENDHGGGGNLMPGMVGHDKLAELAAADGREFDRMFLEYMIRHHQGALTMVRRLYDRNGGNEESIGLFARHVESDQGIEINRMGGLLAQVDELPASSGEGSKVGPKRPAHLAFAGGRPLICVLP
jgi:uncharacterized protein (DUF305 family)